ncbi:hypothetical protein STENM327S_02822 [Streptomyces tendae]
MRGEAPPPTLKVGLNRLGGFRNEVAFVLTGLDIEAKAGLVRAQMEPALGKIADVRWDLARTDRPDAPTEEMASALLRLVVRDPDQQAVGRALSGAAIELALAGYPGFHVLAPPGKGAPYGVFEDVVRSSMVPSTMWPSSMTGGGSRCRPPRTPPYSAPYPNHLCPSPSRPAPPAAPPSASSPVPAAATRAATPTSAVWARTDDAWRWLVHALTADRFRELIPEARDLPLTRHQLPHLRALNFVVEGILGEGVAAQARFDPQAKALGEWLRARHLDIPEVLL